MIEPRTTIHKIIIALPYCLAVIVLIFLLWKNYSPLGQQVIIYDFAHGIPFTQGLTPSTRVQKIDCSQNYCSQEIFDDPTYLDLILPRKFEKLDIELIHQTTTYKMGVGLKLGEPWQYEIQPLRMTSSASDWTISRAQLNLKNAFLHGRSISLLFSIPEIKNNQGRVGIKEIKFIFSRETFLSRVKALIAHL